MTTRRILILAPLVLSLILLQSFFWEPTYEQETKGNPERLHEYIDGSIADATILNPILSADSSSSQIEEKVFEGLIDLDKNLHFRARLATSWNIFEEAFFYVNEAADVPGLGHLKPGQILNFLQAAKTRRKTLSPDLQKTLENIKEISLIPPREYNVHKQLKNAAGTRQASEIQLRVSAPARIKLVLSHVHQELFQHLASLLGENYFKSFDAEKYLAPESAIGKEQLTALAAELLPAVEQNPIIEFFLRPDVKFQDGHPFDADDVKFTYGAIMNPKNLSPRTADYEPVKEVQVMDPHRVRIVYKYLYSPALGTWTMGILPEHLLNAEALRKEALRAGKNPATFSLRDSTFNRHPVGCGPFRFRLWKSDQYIILDRFHDYWEGPPNYHKYVFRVISDILTQEMEFYAGTIDSYNVQPYQVQRLKADPRYQNFSGTSFGYTYIGYNLRREPFNDHRVRTALSMAIDVEKIIKYVLYGQGKRITGPFPLQTDYYNHHVQPIPYDPQGALKLLAEAGWKPNSEGWLEKNGKRFEFTLITNSGNDTRKAVLAIAQDYWKQIGIDVHTDLLEWSVFIQERVEKADFDALVLGWSMGIEPDLYQIWYSTQTGPHQLNFVGFKNKQADELIIEIRQEYNHEKQVEYCHQLHKLIAYEQPYTFLFVGVWTAILDKRIVIKAVDQAGNVVYEKITATKTGNFMYDFNKWVKLPEVPQFLNDK
jgi:ABC-type transport system substrate-binding protein